MLICAPDRPKVLGFARGDGYDVGAELAEFRQHEAVHPLTDGGEKHHRGNAHGDAERGQQRAAAVGGNCTGGKT